MKFIKTLLIMSCFVFLFAGCKKVENIDGIKINLSDEIIKVDEEKISTDENEAVYIANDIIYYESGKDFTYGEGTEKDAHTKEEAESHKVIHISKAGTYILSGKLSKGQIAVDLGKDAKEDPDAVVNLVLNGVDITCDVAPGVIFYNVYECGNTDEDKATKDVDTSNAGANVIIADKTENTIKGSYVEKIYKPESVTLNADKTKVEDAKKLHKYDGAFYSKMSMNINGGEKNTGVLNINAKNEGLDSELHLTINGGNINIISGNDGINTNEDGISVTTINGGNLKISVNGKTCEGDGIDSNGWLVINGGAVTASACSDSADAGIDSDLGIHINGGTVLASGNMLDRIAESKQNYAVYNFSSKIDGKKDLSFKDEKGNVIFETTPLNDYSVLIYSSPVLKEGTYTLWSDGKKLSHSGNIMGGHMGKPDFEPNGERPEIPSGERPHFPSGERPHFPSGENFDIFEIPSREFEKPKGDRPENMPIPPEGENPPTQIPNGRPQRPQMPGKPDGNQLIPNGEGETSEEFKITKGGNMFGNIK
ncbi:MAG: carbohydrate-binding domain-containing protein [Clostridia bacterium]|nr:carbohydrate-binding domain-containing protein [Clostridia bacterium]